MQELHGSILEEILNIIIFIALKYRINYRHLFVELFEGSNYKHQDDSITVCMASNTGNQMKYEAHIR